MAQELMKWKPLKGKAERVARALAVDPGIFGEAVLGYKLYPKQREALRACAPRGCRTSILAANGGGKTSRIIPTLVLWHLWAYPLGKVKVTSGSWPQIETQIWPAIEAHKSKFPNWKWYETPNIKVKPEGHDREGFLHCFSTRNPGFAEGAHEEGDEAPLLYIVDEAKTCPEWLKKVVLGRVRPTRLILLSSSGHAEGWFWETQTKPGDSWKRITIKADDCPHITPEEIQAIRDEWREYPEFAASILGEGFISLVEEAVINGRALDECIANPPEEKPGEVHAFCDFGWSSKRGENVLALRRGNRVTIEKTFHSDHLTASPMNPTPGIVDIFCAEFERLDLRNGQISGDEGSGGKLVMDALDERHWFLNRINNGGTPSNPHYTNIAAETWFEASKLITARTHILPGDLTFRSQALNRKRVKGSKDRLAVEFKEDMVKRNVPSPDRADAVFGAMLPCGGFSTGQVTKAIPCAEDSSAVTWGQTQPGAMIGQLMQSDDEEAMIARSPLCR